MDGQASEVGSAVEEPSYLCYKAYIKTAGYAMFGIYSAIGIKRMRERVSEYMLMEQCTSCRQYGGSGVEILFWGAFDALIYTLAPLSALVALIHADLEWLFPVYAVRALFPSFMLIGPILFTIVSYTVYWFIDLVINVQQVSEDLLDMVVWKRCIWACALLVTNIYALLLTFVVLQLTYYQHYIVIEEQFARQQRNLVNGRIRYRNLRGPRGAVNNPGAVLHNQQPNAAQLAIEDV